MKQSIDKEYEYKKGTGECSICGISSLSHWHPRNSKPRDFVVKEPAELNLASQDKCMHKKKPLHDVWERDICKKCGEIFPSQSIEEGKWEKEMREEFDFVSGADDLWLEIRKYISLACTEEAIKCSNHCDDAVAEVINELDSNPNEDGSQSPNIQHWIERKKSQLKRKFISPNKE